VSEQRAAFLLEAYTVTENSAKSAPKPFVFTHTHTHKIGQNF